MLDASRDENVTIGDLTPSRIGRRPKSLQAQVLRRWLRRQYLVLGFQAVKHVFGWFDSPRVGIPDALGKRRVERGYTPVQIAVDRHRSPRLDALALIVPAIGLSVQVKSHST